MIEAEWDDEQRSRESLLQPRAATACLSQEELEQFLFDRLSGYTREVVEEHLLYCHACLGKVEHEQGFIQVMRDACRGLEAEDLTHAVQPRTPRSWRDWLGWPALRAPALAFALAGLALLVVPFSRMQPGAPVDVALRVERGAPAGGGMEAPARHPLTLRADLAGLPAYENYILAVVDASGRQREEHLVSSAHTVQAVASFRPLDAGQYWVRLYSPGAARELLREYSILIR
jgi:hypothetical protein